MSTPRPDSLATATEPEASVSSGPTGHDLGPMLEPALVAACEEKGGKLSHIRWFRKTWQRGGAATAFAKYTDDTNTTRDVVVKLPVRPSEYHATTGLVEAGAPVPGLAAHDQELGPYHFMWLVMEQLPGDPPRENPVKKEFMALADAVARFEAAAVKEWPITESHPKPRWDWQELFEKSRDAARAASLPYAQEWGNALKEVHKLVPKVVRQWRARNACSWVHGDLHLGNMMFRQEGSPWGEQGPVLIDFAEVRAGHWVEDAVYLERQYWASPEVVKGIKPVSLIARARKKLQLDTSDDYAHLAEIRRFLSAAVVPAFVHIEGHPAYVHAAMQVMLKSAAALS